MPDLTPSGGNDDDEIQAAIDAIAPAGEVIQNTSPIGGTVTLGPGTFLIANPLKLYSYVRLRGQGPNTVLLASALAGKIIEYDVPSPPGHIYCAGAVVEDMRILNTTNNVAAGCIGMGDASQFVQCVIRNIWVGSRGKAIDLMKGDPSTVYSQSSYIERVLIDPSVGVGDTVISMDGNANAIRWLDIKGSVHASYVNGRPLIDFRGVDNDFSGNTIEATFGNGQNGYAFRSKVPFNQSASSIYWRCNHMEVHTTGTGTITDGTVAIFEDTALFADTFTLWVPSTHEPRFGQNSVAYFTDLNISAAQIGLSDIQLDPTAFLCADVLITRYAGGGIAAANVDYRYNIITNGYHNGVAWERRAIRNPPRYYADATANYAQPASLWTVSATNGATFSEADPSGYAQTVTVTSAPAGAALQFTIPLRLSTGDMLEFDVETPGGHPATGSDEVIVWAFPAVAQLPVRSRGGRVRAPIYHAGTTSVRIDVQNIVTGDYVLSAVLVNTTRE